MKYEIILLHRQLEYLFFISFFSPFEEEKRSNSFSPLFFFFPSYPFNPPNQKIRITRSFSKRFLKFIIGNFLLIIRIRINCKRKREGSSPQYSKVSICIVDQYSTTWDRPHSEEVKCTYSFSIREFVSFF